MKLNKLKLSVLFLLLCLQAFGQEIYDLQRFIATGLENNYSIQIARNSETVATNNYTYGNAGFFPSLDLGGRHSGTINTTWENLESGQQSVSRDIYNTTTTAGVNLGWNLFNGFRVQTSYKRLAELKDIGELNTRLSLEFFIARIAAEYYNYVQHLQLLKNLQYAVSLSKERTRIDEERYLIGSGSKLQLLQSQVFLNADSSRLSRQFETVRASLIRLNELIASKNLDQLVQVADTLITVNPDLIYEDLLELAKRDNISLLLAESSYNLSEYDQKIIRSKYYPYLSLGSGYNYTFNTLQGSSIKSRETLGMNYSLSFGIPIFDGFNRKRELSNAALEIINRELQYAEIELEIRSDLLTIYHAYTNNLRLLNFEQQNLGTARENLEIAIERYRLGVLSGLELREVQISLLEAEERLLSVQYQTKLAEISLLQLAGKIMDYI